jgi:hypothetical protein
MKISVRHWPGYTGAHTRDQADGAWPSGTAVKKVRSTHFDARPDGDTGVILGSLRLRSAIMYFVEWDSAPNTAVAIVGWKLERPRQ